MLLQVCFVQEHLVLVCFTSHVELGVSDHYISLSLCRGSGCIGLGLEMDRGFAILSNSSSLIPNSCSSGLLIWCLGF